MTQHRLDHPTHGWLSLLLVLGAAACSSDPTCPSGSVPIGRRCVYVTDGAMDGARPATPDGGGTDAPIDPDSTPPDDADGADAPSPPPAPDGSMPDGVTPDGGPGPDGGLPPDGGPTPDSGPAPECIDSSGCAARPGATALCEVGVCRYTCLPGVDDCDGDPLDGCETMLGTASHCAGCGMACPMDMPLCSSAGGAATCISRCTEGLTDCGGVCANTTDDARNCGACGTACPMRPNSVPICSSGACDFTCAMGFDDCDGDSSNGCERALDSITDCGSCGNACSFANAAARCASGTCTIGTCNGGFDNCDSTPGNGCETPLGTLTDCGGCRLTCERDHAAESCSTGVCTTLICETGYDDCDTIPWNGCERPVNTTTDCGGCGVPCAPAHAMGSCSTGMCTIGSCNLGRGNCDMNAGNGCEASLDAEPNCGACGVSCPGTEVCRASACFDPVVAVSNGSLHTCAVRASGAVLCWGRNDQGQLGDGTTMQRTVPTPVSGISNGLSISSGYEYSCVLRSGGTVWCWGKNDNGQLGHGGTEATNPTPVQVSGLTDAVEVSAGWTSACARRSGGSVVCWGENRNGQIGNGMSSTMPQRTPAAVMSLSDAVEIAASGSTSCARRASGQVVCWGAGGSGARGDGSTVETMTTPQNVIGLTDAIDLSAGAGYFCAVRAGGSVVCWGINGNRQLGAGLTELYSTAPVTVVGLPGPVTQVAGNITHTCVRLMTGGVMCWGINPNGALGDGMSAGSPTAVTVSGLTDALEVQGGPSSTHSCARRGVGSLMCWGGNSQGEIGDGTTLTRRVPTPVSGLGP